MFGVYEVYTWDNVNYTKMAEYESQEEAEKEKQRLTDGRAKVFKPSNEMPTDCICYKVMTDIQYHLLMKNN